MTLLLTLSGQVTSDKMRHLKKKAIFLLAFSLNSGSKYINFYQQDAYHVSGDRARTLMSRIATMAPCLINSFIFVHSQKQIIISVYEDRNVH